MLVCCLILNSIAKIFYKIVNAVINISNVKVIIVCSFRKYGKKAWNPQLDSNKKKLHWIFISITFKFGNKFCQHSDDVAIGSLLSDCLQILSINTRSNLQYSQHH